MPIYEYRCGECGFQKEFLQRMSDALLKDCPQCGKPALKKMVTAAGFQLKGTGWYATDFKNSNAKPAAKAETGAGKAADKPAEAAKSADTSTSAATSTSTSTSTKETPKSDASGNTGASTSTPAS